MCALGTGVQTCALPISTARRGAASSGGNFQQGADAVAGPGWSSCHVMLAYQFAKNTAITARQRDFAGSLPPGNELYPAIRHHRATLRCGQKIAAAVRSVYDIFFSACRPRPEDRKRVVEGKRGAGRV